MLESGNPFDKQTIPSEARQQQIVGMPGEKIEEEKNKVLLALDGTEAGDKAFQYLIDSKTIPLDSHVFVTTVLPANVLAGPWVSGPLSIDSKKQNELLRQLRHQAIERMVPYKQKLKARGFSVTIHVLHGDARASLLKVISFHKIDLVIMYVWTHAWEKWVLTCSQWQAQPRLEEGSYWRHGVCVPCEPLARASARDQVITACSAVHLTMDGSNNLNIYICIAREARYVGVTY